MPDPTDRPATHDVWFNEPCDCDATSDHDYGQEVRD